MPPVMDRVTTLGDLSGNTVNTPGGVIPVSISDMVTVVGLLVRGEVGGRAATPSASFARPADTTAYASGDLVAGSTTAAAVLPLIFGGAARAAGTGMVRRARLKKSGTTTTLATFRLHLYALDPTASGGLTNGDNGAWLTRESGYLGSFDLDMSGSTGRVFSDSAGVQAGPGAGSEVNFALPVPGQTVTLYGLLEARAAYTPASGEVFTVTLEVLQN